MGRKAVDIHPDRIKILREGTFASGPVVYWMSRDQRVRDNWALLKAQETALATKQPLLVVFNLVRGFLGATLRQYDFMLTGLADVERALAKLKIPMVLLAGEPVKTLPAFVKKIGASTLVVDFSPLREPRRWREEVARRISIPMYVVDAHNIVPCWTASDKQEFAAYTIRPKINRRLGEFLTGYPKMVAHPVKRSGKLERIDWEKARRGIRVDRSVVMSNRFQSGESAAHKVLDRFLKKKLTGYHTLSNNPAENYQSDLSPYLHFGQLSAQRVALEVQRFDKDIKSQEGFLEELIVRRELAENFCYYCPTYDSVESFPDWARKTLTAHACDPRQYLYTRDQLEKAETHDELWNAAQTEMTASGKMHGYMRMYWAKKIVEWTPDVAEALAVGIYLNDKYQLDGRDPNGYAGVAWSVGGVHDRAFGEREIFGKVRYMSYAGCKRKFDINTYINRVNELTQEVGA